MSFRNLILVGVVLAGLGASLSVLIGILSLFGPAASREAPPAVMLPPDQPPLRPVALELPHVPTPVATHKERQGGAPGVPVPTAETCSPSGAEPLREAQILSYYGNPYTADMGILGELPPEELVARLKEHATLYDSLNGDRAIQPALHVVYATAQSEPYPEGLYLLYLDDATLQEYIDLACNNGMLIFLDLQIGRSDAETEVTKILPYLESPHVHVALDPEFAMPAGEVPGQSIGSLDATHVNAAQALLDDFLAERQLPDKILIVHQFTEGMLTRPELLGEYERVKLVIDMDGFGPAEIKRVKYGWFAAPAAYSGIKLFFRQDTDLMSEADVLELEPDVIIYQ